MVVHYEGREGQFDSGEPRPLFEIPGDPAAGHAGYVYAVAPDGQRFLMLKNVDKDPQSTSSSIGSRN